MVDKRFFLGPVKSVISVARDGIKTDDWIKNHNDNRYWCKIFLSVSYDERTEQVFESAYMKHGAMIGNVNLDKKVSGKYFGIAKQIFLDKSGREVSVEKQLIFFCDENSLSQM